MKHFAIENAPVAIQQGVLGSMERAEADFIAYSDGQFQKGHVGETRSADCVFNWPAPRAGSGA